MKTKEIRVEAVTNAVEATEPAPLWSRLDVEFRQLVLTRAPSKDYGETLNGRFAIVWTRQTYFFIDIDNGTVVPSFAVSYAVPAK